jgi:aspartate dehydrogenase
MLAVAVIGRGAIGAPVIEALRGDRLPGARLSGVLARSVRAEEEEVDSLDALLARRPGLVIEAAGQGPARAMAAEILASGIDLLLFSVGALADSRFEAECAEAGRAGGGRLFISTGAVGGLDMLRTLRAAGTLERVTLRSTTRSAALVQPWMAPEEAERIRAATEPLTVFEGSAREACLSFPASANVAAAIALSSLGLDRVCVTIVADPGTPVKRHAIEAVSPECTMRLEVENLISPENPRTSRITPYAALRFISDRTEATIAGD